MIRARRANPNSAETAAARGAGAQVYADYIALVGTGYSESEALEAAMRNWGQVEEAPRAPMALRPGGIMGGPLGIRRGGGVLGGNDALQMQVQALTDQVQALAGYSQQQQLQGANLERALQVAMARRPVRAGPTPNNQGAPADGALPVNGISGPIVVAAAGPTTFSLSPLSFRLYKAALRLDTGGIISYVTRVVVDGVTRALGPSANAVIPGEVLDAGTFHNFPVYVGDITQNIQVDAVANGAGVWYLYATAAPGIIQGQTLTGCDPCAGVGGGHADEEQDLELLRRFAASLGLGGRAIGAFNSTALG